MDNSSRLKSKDPATEKLQSLISSMSQASQSKTNIQTLHQLFEEQVLKSPDKTALIFEKQSLTYSELNQKSNRLAHRIREHYYRKHGGELPADTLIALYLNKGFSMVIGILAIIKAGGAYVPISPDYPKQRVELILKDTATKLVLTETDYLDKLLLQVINFEKPPEFFSLDQESAATSFSNKNPISINIESDLAYVIYTSGTTGKPKGVLIPHRGVSSLVLDTNYIEIESNDTLLFYSDYCFDAATFEIWGALLSGASLVIARDKSHLSVKSFESLLNTHHISILWITRSLFDNLYLQNHQIFSQLRYLITGGEALTPNLMKRFISQQGRPKYIINAYGPTESTTFATTYLCSDFEGSVPIGKAISTRQLYLLDNQGQLITSPGIAGELHIGGTGLARGYLNNPELTEQRFIEYLHCEPESNNQSYICLYKTGDQVRYLPDGNLEFLGRNDSQVKLRGYRIELAEIENVLIDYPQIDHAVVIVHQQEQNPCLVAYIVAADNKVISRQKIRDYLKHKLPEYMLPASINFISSLPITANGKLDYQKLAEPRFSDDTQFQAARNNLEKKLCEIWQDVLGIKQVGIDDNFFSLGGSSITAIRLAARAQKELGMDISLLQLSQYKNIAQLAPQLSKTKIHIPKSNDQTVLSYAQQRLLFLQRLDKTMDAYHIPCLVKLNQNVEFDNLRETFQAIIERHTVLSGRYCRNEKTGDYLKLSDSEISIHSCRVNNHNELIKRVKSASCNQFDLAKEIPIRLYHYQLKNDSFLLIVWHHIAFDGSSVEVFMRDFAAIYKTILQGRDMMLPPLEISYMDYAFWQKQRIQGEKREELLSFWKQHLAGFETLNLPVSYKRPAQYDYSGRNHQFRLKTILSDKVRQLARQEETTVYTILLSAYYLTLSTISGQNKVVVGTPSDNRQHPQTQSLIGFFVNSLALNIEIDPHLKLSEFISQVHQVVIEGKIHQELPFEQVVDALCSQRDPSRNPIYQAVFSLQNFWENSFSDKALPFSPYQMETGSHLYSPALVDLSLFMSDAENEICGFFNYAVSLFCEKDIKRIEAVYLKAIDLVVNDIDKPIEELSFLPEQEINTLLNRPMEPVSNEYLTATLHQLFEEQVLRTPERTALIFNGESLSYTELNQRSNQLAYAIRESYQRTQQRELQADTLIALFLDRSFEMVISLLAVLKSGAAYVPISPDIPEQRIEYIINEIQPAILITQEKHQENLQQRCHQIKITPTLIVADLNENTHNIYHYQPTTNLNPTSCYSDLAYVIYTSGTTGVPNGVMIEHGVSAARNSYMSKLGNAVDDTYLFKTNYIFDVSVSDLFSHLLSGGKVVITQSSFDIDEIEQLIKRWKINACHFVPSQISAFSNESLSQMNLSKLNFSGENLTSEVLRRINFEQTQCINYYGPTETGECTFFRAQTVSEAGIIGKPFAGSQAYILQNGKQLAALGVVGELYISGTSLARGYYNNHKLTKSRFLDNPFASPLERENGLSKMYKTGDLARWLPDGNLEYLGRNDFQVKIQGHRIELTEIELALSQFAEIEQAVVIKQQNENNQFLAAYIIFVADKTLSKDSIRHRLSLELPEYMLPASINIIEQLPLTNNGKLDRQALPKALLDNQTDYVAPRTSLERGLCEVWQQVLGCERVGIDDNFFSIGGNSFLLVQVSHQIKKSLGVNFPIKRFYKDNTIRRLVANSHREKLVQLEREACLAEDICPIDRDSSHFNENAVLLTGSTGFVGRYLLAELLNNTEAEIYCLVRAEDITSGFERVKSSLTDYLLWNDSYQRRIKIVLGDLSLNQLGMSDKQYQYLSQTIGYVYHSAVYMSHLASYDDMKQTNVEGLQSLLRFVCHRKNKKLAYMSTIGVFNNRAERVVTESTDIRQETHFVSDGYLATKWVAENLLLTAIERKIDIDIYRLGLTAGSQALGKNDPSQWFQRLLKTCLNIGYCFREHCMKIPLIPIDFTVQSIVALTLSDSQESIYHLNARKDIEFVELVETYNSQTKNKIKLVSMAEFVKQLVLAKSKGIEIPAEYLFSDYMFQSEEAINEHLEKICFTKVDSQQSLSSLRELGIEAPEVSDDFIVKYFYDAQNS